MAETTHFAGKLILKYDTSSALRNKRFAFWARGAQRCHHESTRSRAPKVKQNN